MRKQSAVQALLRQGQRGFPPDALRSQSEDLALMYEWFDRTGYVADINGLRRDFPEVDWHDFAAWMHKQDWSILDTPEPAPAIQEG